MRLIARSPRPTFHALSALPGQAAACAQTLACFLGDFLTKEQLPEEAGDRVVPPGSHGLTWAEAGDRLRHQAAEERPLQEDQFKNINCFNRATNFRPESSQHTLSSIQLEKKKAQTWV